MSNYTILYMGSSFADHYLNTLRGSVLTMLNRINTNETLSFKPIAFAIVNDKSIREKDFYLRHEGSLFTKSLLCQYFVIVISTIIRI